MKKLSLLLLLAAIACSMTSSRILAEESAGPVNLRGFGKVEVNTKYYGEGDARSSWITFKAQDAAHAILLGSKYKADLLGFGDLKAVDDTGLKGTVLELERTGFWLIGQKESDCHVIFARNREELAKLAKEADAAGWSPLPDRAFPRWMNGFDNDATAIWYGGGGAPVDNDTDFEWLKAHQFSFCAQPPTESRYIAPGILDTSITDWFAAMAAKYDLGYRLLLWPRKPAWIWNITPLPHVTPYKNYLAHPSLEYQARAMYSVFEPVPASDKYTLDFRRRVVAGLNDDPNLLGHHGLDEMPGAGVLQLAAVAGMPEAKKYWHAYLQKTLGFDLQKVGQLYRGNSKAYKTWEDVSFPLPHDFIGYNAKSLNLDGIWEGKADPDKKGVEAKWFAASTDSEGWSPIDCNDPILLLNTDKKGKGDSNYWLRRTVKVDQSQIKDLKYLHIARANWHSSVTPLFEAYLNGTPLKTLSKDSNSDFEMCYEVGNAVHEGENLLVLNTKGNPAPGYLFMGSTPLRRYPYMTEQENRLWFDATNFSAWLRLQTVERTLSTMRAADPNRPFKMMATINLLDMTGPLCERYGAYQHDTGGAGGYWCPMTGARLARSHGLPWSCEQGGPPKDAAELQSAMTFYLMYGNDAVDLVFGVTHYKDKPDIAQWVDNNLSLMHTVGKMDMPKPAVAILRSTRVTRLGFQEPWNWDLGRGALQGVGRNFVYLEMPDIASGLINQYPVVIDDGTVLLTEEDVKGIKRYVEQGGTFVAQHNTARHLPERGDAWPLAGAFGLKVEPKLITAENFNFWPLGKIEFAENEDLVPSLKGKKCEGSGISIDYLGDLKTGAISLKGKGAGITPVARWEDGTMAIADIKFGKGRLLYMGSPFYLRLRDTEGKYLNAPAYQVILDEMLTSLGAPRDSWTGQPDVWAECWKSKNGIYDLYPVARMTKKGEETLSLSPVLRREKPLAKVVEMSANQHPDRAVEWKDGRFTLPQDSYGYMQTRIFAAPRADIESGALHWFDIQKQIWRALPEIPRTSLSKAVEGSPNILPLIKDWRAQVVASPTDENWIKPGFDAAAWKPVKLGAFASMGIPEDGLAQFRCEATLPEAWKGKRVSLVFDAEGWFWGISQKGRLWINGQPANLKQPIVSQPESGFTLDVTDQVAEGKLSLALEIDGKKLNPSKPRFRPSGTTGAFYLQVSNPSVAKQPLAGPWFAAMDVNHFVPAVVGKNAKFVYLQTTFKLPQKWSGKRVFLESPGPLGQLILNHKVISAPYWMRRLDVSKLVKKEGDNVLRWSPVRGVMQIDNPVKMDVPELALVWEP